MDGSEQYLTVLSYEELKSRRSPMVGGRCGAVQSVQLSASAGPEFARAIYSSGSSTFGDQQLLDHASQYSTTQALG